MSLNTANLEIWNIFAYIPTIYKKFLIIYYLEIIGKSRTTTALIRAFLNLNFI